VGGRSRALGLITPKPWRGPLIAAGAVPLTVGVLMAEERLGWSRGVVFAVSASVAALLLAMALLSPLEFARPRSYQVVLALCGLVLALAAVGEFANLVNAPSGARTTAWVFALFALLAGTVAWRRNAWIGTLLAALAGLVAAVALVDWLFAASDRATWRYVLLGSVAVLVLGSVLLRGSWPRHSAALVDAAGVAVLAIVVLLLVDRYIGAGLGAYFARSGGVSLATAGGSVAWGWELFVVAAGLGLVAYAGADQERGPGYLGVLTLIGFIALVAPLGPGQTPTIVGWPIVLLALGGLAIAAGLRPSRPLPPEPGSGDEAPPPIELRPSGRDGPT